MDALIFIIVLFAFAWLFLILPSRRRQRSHRAMQDSVEIGDEIITAGGIHATVRELGDEELRVEIAPGVVTTLDRRAVAAVARDVPLAEEDDEPAEAAEPEKAEKSLKG
jgi:preprotein translocase subunit YajC